MTELGEDGLERYGEEEGKYWFYSTIEPTTQRLVVMGEFDSRETATREAFGRLSNSFEVFSMPTKDRAKATQHAKYVMFNRGESLEKAIRRAKHQI